MTKCRLENQGGRRKKRGNDNVMDRLAEYEERVNGVSRKDREELIPALALRSYHLPDYSYCDDWLQYFQNNHPVFGMCCHHKLHPIGFKIRVLHLIGSVMFGLTVTNVIWLWFFYSGSDQNEPAVTIRVGGFNNSTATGNAPDSASSNTIASSQSVFEISQGMLLIWTVGGGLHALFDNTVWYISACVCCLSSRSFKKFQCCGTYCILLVVLTFTAMATLAVLLRTSIEASQKNTELAVGGAELDETVRLGIQEGSAYEFLISYALELALALFVYNPVVGTILFSGILGCGVIPILGGRPYEIKAEERRKQRKQFEEGNRDDASTDSFGSERV